MRNYSTRSMGCRAAYAEEGHACFETSEMSPSPAAEESGRIADAQPPAGPVMTRCDRLALREVHVLASPGSVGLADLGLACRRRRTRFPPLRLPHRPTHGNGVAGLAFPPPGAICYTQSQAAVERNLRPSQRRSAKCRAMVLPVTARRGGGADRVPLRRDTVLWDDRTHLPTRRKRHANRWSPTMARRTRMTAICGLSD